MVKKLSKEKPKTHKKKTLNFMMSRRGTNDEGTVRENIQRKHRDCMRIKDGTAHAASTRYKGNTGEGRD